MRWSVAQKNNSYTLKNVDEHRGKKLKFVKLCLSALCPGLRLICFNITWKKNNSYTLKNAADTGWRVKVDQENHPLSEYEFDVLIGADGKRNTLQGETLYTTCSLRPLYGGTCVIYL